MSTAPHTIQEFARRLIALEGTGDESPTAPNGVAVRVCERLRVPLSRLAGVAGFRSLLSRALVLAKAEVGSLAPVLVREDGSLDGFDKGWGGSAPGGEGGVAVVTQLLGLLVTFVGEPLTRQLVREVWPDTDEADGTAGGQP